MRIFGFILAGLLAILALLIAVPGALFAAAEVAVGRNLAWGPVLLVAHSAAAICALFWGLPLLTRGEYGKGYWILGYMVVYVIGYAALESMHISFMP